MEKKRKPVDNDGKPTKMFTQTYVDPRTCGRPKCLEATKDTKSKTKEKRPIRKQLAGTPFEAKNIGKKNKHI